MRAPLGAICFVVLFSGMGCGELESDERREALEGPPAGGPSSADPAALELADSVVAELGGWKAWNQARYLEFTFSITANGEVRRRTTHRWDRFTGEYRLDGVTRDGKPFVAIWNLQSGGGETWLADQELAGEEEHEQLERARALCVNDCYWFLMPFKLHDPGVHLQDAGARVDSLGKSWRVVALTFDDNVGMTSGDRYWVYVDPATGEVGRWDYVLESYEPNASPSMFSWQEWQKIGPVRLALDRRSADGNVEIRFEDVVVASGPPQGAFTYQPGS